MLCCCKVCIQIFVFDVGRIHFMAICILTFTHPLEHILWYYKRRQRLTFLLAMNVLYLIFCIRWLYFFYDLGCLSINKRLQGSFKYWIIASIRMSFSNLLLLEPFFGYIFPYSAYYRPLLQNKLQHSFCVSLKARIVAAQWLPLFLWSCSVLCAPSLLPLPCPLFHEKFSYV